MPLSSYHQMQNPSMVSSQRPPDTPSPQLDILPWLKTLPLAPQYHPTLVDFQDPISFILKIEQEASYFGICKIVPPLPTPSKKTTISNLNRSFSSHSQPLVSLPHNSTSRKNPTFTTRQQQIGFCPCRPHPAKKPIWQSGESYGLSEFEDKSKQFKNAQLKKFGKKGQTAGFSPLQVETLFWKAKADKPYSVEYANDMPGSGFALMKEDGGEVRRLREEDDWDNMGDTSWNMRGVSRTNGSLLKFMNNDIPGVTTPMVYVAMMFSWFSWHVEDHELHSLNYSHLGAGKAWYGIPRAVRLAFEEVVRVQGYDGEVNPLATLFILSEKTTIMSFEILVAAGVPCCRLVQNPREFVITFAGAYHSGFSLGFNYGEAANIATPEWLKVAKEAAIRRASINHPPMVSHFQLLYDLALSLCSRMVGNNGSEPRSSRLKGKMKGEGEMMIKEQFVKNVIQTNYLFGSITLDDKLSCVLLPRNTYDASLGPNSSSIGSQIKVEPSIDTQEGEDDDVVDDDLTESSFPASEFTGINHSFNCNKSGGLLDQRLLSCVTCGILSFACVAIVRPTDAATMHLMTYGCSSLSDQSSDKDNIRNANPSRYDDVVGSRHLLASTNNDEKSTYSGKHHALSLIASAYGDSSDYSDDDIPWKCKSNSSSFLMNKPDKDSSRMHVFCLEYALMVQRKLRSIGGARLLLVCHPDYPKIEAEVKPVAEELGVDYAWDNISFKEMSGQDEERIRSALEDKGAVPKNSDWSVMMGFNLWFSANISKSFLYSKQMPYNVVIYNTFGRDSSSASPGKLRKMTRNGRLKKKVVVSGKWCGKVCMSNQVHPYLVYVNENNEEEEDDYVKILTTLVCRRKILVDFANHVEVEKVTTPTSSSLLETEPASRSAIKRKKPSKKEKYQETKVQST